MRRSIDLMAETMDVYACNPEMCQTALGLAETGVSREEITTLCEAMKRRMVQNPDFAAELALDGLPCGQDILEMEAYSA